MASSTVITSRDGEEYYLDPAPSPSVWNGLPVQTYDGKSVGAVVAVESDLVKIRRFMRRDFYLPKVLVRGAKQDCLVLHVSKRTLNRYQSSVYSRPELAT